MPRRLRVPYSKAYLTYYGLCHIATARFQVQLFRKRSYGSSRQALVGVWEYVRCFPAIHSVSDRFLRDRSNRCCAWFSGCVFIFSSNYVLGAGVRGFGFVAGHGGVSAGCPLSLGRGCVGKPALDPFSQSLQIGRTQVCSMCVGCAVHVCASQKELCTLR